MDFALVWAGQGAVWAQKQGQAFAAQHFQGILRSLEKGQAAFSWGNVGELTSDLFGEASGSKMGDL